MIRLRETREIPLPRDEAFGYVADFANVAEWDPGVATSVALDEGPPRRGSRYRVGATFMGRTIPLTYEITEFDPPNLVVLTTSSPAFDGVDRIRFTPVGEAATRVDYEADFTLKGPLRFIEPLLRPAFNRLGTKALDGLAATARRRASS